MVHREIKYQSAVRFVLDRGNSEFTRRKEVVVQLGALSALVNLAKYLVVIKDARLERRHKYPAGHVIAEIGAELRRDAAHLGTCSEYVRRDEVADLGHLGQVFGHRPGLEHLQRHAAVHAYR